ncbi:MAG: 4Fe-4S dicluster domain-containing protein [Thermodesulfobacteriota bacterium]
MSPQERFFSPASLRSWLDRLIAGQPVVGPCQRGANTVFAPLTGAGDWQADLLLPKTPAKGLVFPPRRAVGDTTVVPAILWGARPCELQALDLIDRVFLQEPADPVYHQRRLALTTVAFACPQAADTCFCTRVGSHPADRSGADLLLVPVAGGHLATAGTGRGAELLAGAGEPPTAEQLDAGAAFVRACEEEGQAAAPLPATLAALFDSPLWEDLSRGCLSCGVCSFLCPTCHCFDIADERTGKVVFWDCCAFPDFTLMTSGENPRKSPAIRLRNRILHKFDYLVRTVGRRGCVGCGRCVANCPAGLDLVAALAALEAAAAKE